ncbi:MAG: Uma2 family endonuclease [Oscillospiraceae bacterium]|nr:Uma2 family endonuclease [Oscillospiraceae bacterium]MDE5885686.1 Uma2 family endonuclease [Oscillospiraceae bacterium]
MEENIKILADEFFALLNRSKQRQELIDGTLRDLDPCTVQHQQTVVAISNHIRRYINRSEHAGTVLPFCCSRMDQHNVLFPDIQVTLQTVPEDSTCFEGVPDWIIEVVSSDAPGDYFEKLDLYKNLGVREYWIVNPVRKQTTVLYPENETTQVNLYEFEQSVPVGIYKEMPDPLEICIEAL